MTQLNEEHAKLLRLYGRLPDKRDLMKRKLQERKYFDSGDYALSQAGKELLAIGSEHPCPDNIPHSNPNPLSTSPIQESPLVSSTGVTNLLH
ncbi:camp-regulated phosphoprotein/endosulfine conserved region-domain-containing protein [Radiomyces spectabilis]|uniref:camp-regulated phosphoprotein/endosulfine conserved region-domain-containing protein n=1 Tax=Radiomyces spectabilis TaxID=64574 RepID=UPI0022203D4E|nr:camp-regulated phosphoprotein/endosulfine conserved region-domain-containing protein [Radiomyces spectabilis]KAI8371503.1 camp-regulated phosphoprotein/endosulfine conserved region-domain-containing protein [Radiomyces spectabilis]